MSFSPSPFPVNLFFVFFWAIFAVIVITIVYQILKNAGTWISNNASEVVTVPARIVAKRTDVWGGSGNTSASTSYYATFEFANKERLELQLKDKQFGLLAEGDQGVLTYQGTRFHHFQRSL
ncbi:DUF2500 domain-containing protein [Paenibacillus hamazuiensis]|uniref:DUF2500 domain-containing protein n=1 Tax=Paenibacillus hamazuiensis TaxID=2936508 RepID=UPI00200C1A1F|nr:DUF2500 domain-containing protein [Paenibacillus hamazuiensis]